MISTTSKQQLKHELNQKWTAIDTRYNEFNQKQTAIETWVNPKVNSNWYKMQWVQPKVNSNWNMSLTGREFDSTSRKHCLVFRYNLRNIFFILQLPGDAFLWRPSGWQVTYPQQQQFEASAFSNCWRIHKFAYRKWRALRLYYLNNLEDASLKIRVFVPGNMW